MHKEDGGNKIRVQINSYVFRDYDFKKEKTKKRIMVYGDTFIEGELSPLEKNFAKLLQT